jgi:tetratricopeptide (TPR) repeat protein
LPNNLVTAAIELRKKGDNRGAISLLRQHISECPDDLIATHNLAAALCDAGYHLESSDVAKHAIGKGLHKPQTFLVYARALANLSEHKKATSAYHEVLSLEPGNTEAHKELAQLIWMREGNYREALEPITRAIKSIPHSIQLKLLRAELAGQMGNQHDRYRWTKQCFDTPRLLTKHSQMT